MAKLEVKRALLSVYYKDNIIPFAKYLQSMGVEILSTGGTFRILDKNGIKCIPIGEFTGLKEFFGGRVKTLHPLIHGGILSKRDEESKKLGIKTIDLVVVNFYPFENLVSSGEKSIKNLIEMIDIGGPTLLRAASKNYKYVCPVPSPEYYDKIIEEIKNGGIKKKTRLKMAAEVFKATAYYDALIARTLIPDNNFDKTITIPLRKENELRYGENPHQTSAYYSIPGRKNEKTSDFFKKGKLHGKELSYNNIQDISAVIRILGDLPEESSVVLKHSNPCGAASRNTTHESFLAAYEGDKVSIFGGIVGFKGELKKETAEVLSEIFLEIIIAKSFDKEALKILSKKKNIRLLEYNKWEDIIFNDNKIFETKRVLDGYAFQTKDEINSYQEELKCATSIKPSDTHIEDLKFAQTIVKHVKSNAIVVVKDKMLLGVGAGQMNRITAAKIALDWAGDKANGAVLASDAFFPMDDTVKLAGKIGISAIIQPGGSIKDQDSIDTCDKLGIPMVFTGTRHFLH
ncbi:MAG: bifunctional phosphoribosylaminoimidazolecarboxamide formyltransferase/IMP cyclohydrolase [Spirochaetes bacterium]|nr:bifunctional phosphoribosylaminoimidazolecarboxamide formyltransferase/IMP cyclohydrolase [Spirochaetota bacterium]